MENAEFNIRLKAWLFCTNRRTIEQLREANPVSPKELCDLLDDQIMGDRLISIDEYETLRGMKAAIMEAEQEYLKNHPAQ